MCVGGEGRGEGFCRFANLIDCNISNFNFQFIFFMLNFKFFSFTEKCKMTIQKIVQLTSNFIFSWAQKGSRQILKRKNLKD